MTYDYIVIGSGIAGTILSNELSETSNSILLIECGERKINKFYNKFYKGNISSDSLKHGDPDKYRNIILGGTSKSWGGAICKLNNHDFKIKDKDGENYWPFDKFFLEKFYKKAEIYFGMDNTNNNNFSVFNKENIKFKNFDTNVLYRKYGKSINFEKYLKNKKFNLILDTQVLDFEINDSQIKSIITYNYKKKERKSFRGKKIIICTGGIESTRLVLSSKLIKNIKNRGIVGKYYSPHVTLPLGIISKINKHSPDIMYDYNKINNQLTYKPFLNTNQNLVQDQNLLNSRFIFNINLENFYNYNNIFNNINKKSFINSILPKNNLLVQLDSDQTPNIDSKIFLSNQKNTDNLNRIEIEHKILHNDWEKIEKLKNIFLMEMINKGWRFYGISNKFYKKYIFGMSHHMGTLKMSKNKEKGIINENLRFYDFENLYLCSSACFPTYGHANPSYTIGALACMLAQNLKNNVN